MPFMIHFQIIWPVIVCCHVSIEQNRQGYIEACLVHPLLQWQGNKHYLYWMCVCSLRYPACSAHVPYCHLWPVQLYCVFPHYLINGTNLKKYWNIKFHENPSKGSLVGSYGRTDMVKLNSWFLHFCEGTKKLEVTQNEGNCYL
jgi:hypothetical protein